MNVDNERKNFINDLSIHPELLDFFSNDRLEKILNYYRLENEKKKQKIKKLEKTLKSS